MLPTATEKTQVRHWRHGVAIEYCLRARRGVPLPGASHASVIVLLERVLNNAQLDPATRLQLTRILGVTAQDWARN